MNQVWLLYSGNTVIFQKSGHPVLAKYTDNYQRDPDYHCENSSTLVVRFSNMPKSLICMKIEILIKEGLIRPVDFEKVPYERLQNWDGKSQDFVESLGTHCDIFVSTYKDHKHFAVIESKGAVIRLGRGYCSSPTSFSMGPVEDFQRSHPENKNRARVSPSGPYFTRLSDGKSIGLICQDMTEKPQRERTREPRKKKQRKNMQEEKPRVFGTTLSIPIDAKLIESMLDSCSPETLKTIEDYLAQQTKALAQKPEEKTADFA